jgi:hypothetical protein
VSLTKEAAEVTGIPYIMNSDLEEADRILFGSEEREESYARK